MNGIVPYGGGEKILTPEVIRETQEATAGISFTTLGILAHAAGLGIWMTEHKYDARGIARQTREAFRTPVPSQDVATWREELGYKYGHDLPIERWAIDLDDPESGYASNGWWSLDTGIRVVLAVPENGEKEIRSDLDQPTLRLNVKTNKDAPFKPADMTAKVGEGQIGNGEILQTRSIQELLLVAARFANLARRVDMNEVARIPKLGKRRQRKAIAELTE